MRTREIATAAPNWRLPYWYYSPGLLSRAWLIVVQGVAVSGGTTTWMIRLCGKTRSAAGGRRDDQRVQRHHEVGDRGEGNGHPRLAADCCLIGRRKIVVSSSCTCVVTAASWVAQPHAGDGGPTSPGCSPQLGDLSVASPLGVPDALVGEEGETVTDGLGADETQGPGVAGRAEQTLAGPEHDRVDRQP